MQPVFGNLRKCQVFEPIQKWVHWYMVLVFSKIDGGGSMGTVTGGLWSSYWGQMIEDIKNCQPEVKASQSDKRLQQPLFIIVLGNMQGCIYL